MIGRSESTSALVEELRIWNTPVIGAYLAYRFVKTFAQKRPDKRPPDLIMLCLAIAVLSDRRLSSNIRLRRGISSFRRYLEGEKNAVAFDGIHDVVAKTLPYTLAAIDIALACGIVRVNAESATIEAVDFQSRKGTNDIITTAITEDVKIIETLAKWFAKFENSSVVADKLEVLL